MSLRTIMIFPEFENTPQIDRIRDLYDPLAGLVRPHITLVFPFALDMSDEELADILDTRLSSVKPFDLEMQGFTAIVEESENYLNGTAFSGNYLFLNVTKGEDQICRIHDILYENEFSVCASGIPYMPHMTVGKLPDPEALNKAYDDVKDIRTVFSKRIDTVSVERIGEHDESIIIIRKKLGFPDQTV